MIRNKLRLSDQPFHIRHFQIGRVNPPIAFVILLPDFLTALIFPARISLETVEVGRPVFDENSLEVKSSLFSAIVYPFNLIRGWKPLPQVFF